MMPSKITFGTDGWRAILGEVFTEENVARVAQALVTYLQQKNLTSQPVAVGFDGRTNSKFFAELVARILSGSGMHVFLSTSVIPTPVLSFAVKHRGCSAGVMITASHNPPNYNGVKFKASYGGPFMSEEIRAVEQLIPEKANAVQSDSNITVQNFLPEYIEQIKTIVDFNMLQSFADNPASNASVMVDSMGGAGQTIIEDILTGFGWRVQTIFGALEPNFYDRLPEPIEKNLGPLMYNTQVTDAIIGIATDGDADRCSIVYEDGKWMSTQENILALVWHLHQNKQWSGAIIKSASVTDKVRLLVERWNGKIFDVSVGFKYITEAMLKEDFMFGGEESGGFGYKYHLPERDGILSGLMFCEMIAMTGKSLRQIMDKIYSVVGNLHYDRIDAHYDKPDRSEILPKLFNQQPFEGLEPSKGSVKTYEEAGVITGLKYLLGDSRWLLIRTSQTEPMIRIYAEGQSENEVKKLLEEGKRLVGI